MDKEIKEEFNKVGKAFEGIKEEFKKTNELIDKMSEFMMTHVALKLDLRDLATKDDLQDVKSDIFTKVDGLAYHYKNLDEEKLATGRRLDRLELKTGIV